MSGTHTIVMGDRGRLVIPADVRRRAALSEGKALILLELDEGIVILTREQLKARVRSSLSGESLVDELLRDRRREAASDSP